MATLSRQPDEPQPTAPIISPEAGKPENVPPGTNETAATTAPETDYGEDIDLSYWVNCMDDAERAESDWRKRGREIVQIYRNEKAAATKGKSVVSGNTT